jgi:hypothetical protein
MSAEISSCVDVIARFTTVDVPPDETSESLLRFEQRCTGAMRTAAGERA